MVSMQSGTDRNSLHRAERSSRVFGRRLEKAYYMPSGQDVFEKRMAALGGGQAAQSMTISTIAGSLAQAILALPLPRISMV